MSQGQQQQAIIPMYEVAVFLKGGNIFTTLAAEVEIKRSRFRKRITSLKIDGFAPGAAIPNITIGEVQAVSWKHVDNYPLYPQQPEGDHDVHVQTATEAQEEGEAGEPGPQAEQTARGIIGIGAEAAGRNMAAAMRAIAEQQPSAAELIAQEEQAAPGEEYTLQETGEQPRKIRIEYRAPKKLNRAERRAQAKAAKGKGQR